MVYFHVKWRHICFEPHNPSPITDTVLPPAQKGAKTGSNEGASRSLSVVWGGNPSRNGAKNPSFSSHGYRRCAPSVSTKKIEDRAERQQGVLPCMKMSSFEWFHRDSLHRMLPRHTGANPTKDYMALKRPGPNHVQNLIFQ